METTPRKGMSKGCVIGLIIGLSIIVLFILSLVLLWVFRGSFAKAGAGAAAIELKQVLAADPPEGIDTTQFNALADAFVDRVKLESDDQFETVALLVQQFYSASKDRKLTREEAMTAAAAMINQYPELEQYWIPKTEEVTTPVQDSTGGV
jgi:hypothetical protein